MCWICSEKQVNVNMLNLSVLQIQRENVKVKRVLESVYNKVVYLD